MSKPATLHVHHAIFLSISLPSLHNPLLLPSSNRAIWDKRRIVLKNAKSIFQQRFPRRRRCRMVRSLMMKENNKT